jgi:hypothetical protein
MQANLACGKAGETKDPSVYEGLDMRECILVVNRTTAQSCYCDSRYSTQRASKANCRSLTSAYASRITTYLLRHRRSAQDPIPTRYPTLVYALSKFVVA